LKSDKKSRARKLLLQGSERRPVRGAREIGPVNPSERVDVTIIVRHNPASHRGSTEELGRVPPKKRTHQSREEFARTQGASQEDLKKISEFAREYRLVVKESSQARRSVTLSGTAKQLSEAFGVELKSYEHPTVKGKTFRGRSGPLYIPEALSEIIQAVLGLDNRPQANPRLRPLLPGQVSTVSYNPQQVAKLYDYPAGLNGQGECIGIVELGGGTNQSDLNTYFQSLGLNPPKVVSVSVDGGTNTPTGDPSGPDGEVMLDVEVAGSVANSATIALYFAPNTDMGFVDAVTTAINDSQNKPSVISISWGSAENTWTTQAITALNNALEDGASMGVTICVASGDGGSSDGETDGLAHVDFPASSPYVLGCGGTSLPSISGEVVWNDQPQDGATGGGVSDVFPLPTWQSSAKVPPSANPGSHIGRGVPDVAGDADPATGYSVQVDGEKIILGGTSAVAPLWAGLVVLINQKLGHSLGYFNPILYADQLSSDLHDITKGNNGAYSAGPGWNACTGNGSPDGSKLMNAIFSMPEAS
jgi:kumamolisin